MVDGVAGVFFEDTPFFAKNYTCDETFLLAAEQRSPEGTAQSASLSSGAVTVNYFHSEDTGLFGLAQFRKEELARFVNCGKTGFNVKSFEGRHGGAREIVPEARPMYKQGEYEGAGKRRMTQGAGASQTVVLKAEELRWIKRRAQCTSSRWTSVAWGFFHATAQSCSRSSSGPTPSCCWYIAFPLV